MDKTCSLVRICFAVAVLGLTGVAVGCGERADLLRPSALPGAHASASGAPTDALKTGDTSPSPELGNSGAPGSAAHLNPTELGTRGWTCLQFAAAPNRIVCSRPNQGFPTIGNPPPDERPATFTFLVFDGSGLFVGTEILIRTELYNGQLCESTGQPFIFRDRIGYYECVRTIGS